MDIDDEVVPDTPDRSITARYNDGDSIRNRSGGSSSCRVIDKEHFNEKVRNETSEKGNSVTMNSSRRLFVRPDKNSNSSSFMLGNPSSFKNSVNTVDNGHNDKGKALFSGNAHWSTIREGSSFVDLTEQNGRGVFGKASTHVSRKPVFPNNGFSASNNTVKLGPRSDRGKGVVVGAEQKAESNSFSLDITPPRVNKHKRLVRNGCISPNNIAKSKQVAETHETGRVAEDLRVDVGSMPLNGPTSRIDIKDLVAETKDSHRFKGKGISHHPSFFDEVDARSRHMSHRYF